MALNWLRNFLLRRLQPTHPAATVQPPAAVVVNIVNNIPHYDAPYPATAQQPAQEVPGILEYYASGLLPLPPPVADYPSAQPTGSSYNPPSTPYPAPPQESMPERVRRARVPWRPL